MIDEDKLNALELFGENEYLHKEIERLKDQLNDEIQEELKQSEIMVKKHKEIERLNNIIKRLEEDLREMYLTFGEFSEEYTENRIRELKGSDKE